MQSLIEQQKESISLCKSQSVLHYKYVWTDLSLLTNPAYSYLNGQLEQGFCVPSTPPILPMKQEGYPPWHRPLVPAKDTTLPGVNNALHLDKKTSGCLTTPGTHYTSTQVWTLESQTTMLCDLTQPSVFLYVKCERKVKGSKIIIKKKLLHSLV